MPYKMPKKPVPLRRKIWRLVIWMIGITVVAYLGVLFYREVIRHQLQSFIFQILGVDLVLLGYALFYVFLICGLILMMLVHWVGWENLRFKFKQMQYRSALVVKDYYKEQQRLHVDGAIGSVNNFRQQKLDVSGKEDEERLLAEMESGKVTIPVGRIFFKNGRLDGTFFSYHENGRIESEVNYKNGHLDGPFRTFYMDGRMRAEKFYKGGKLDGVFRAWDQDGSPFFEISYRDGKQDGTDKTYYQHGILQFLDTYRDGKLVLRKTYDEGGSLVFEEMF